MKACLGFDTSCYTTSVAVCRVPDGAEDGSFYQARKLLSVPMGKRGLAQSEMVFQHVRRLPELVATLLAEHPRIDVAAVCASVRPRPQGDSYMPVFCVGESTAKAIAAAMRVPFFETTHQEVHIRSARVGTSLSGGDSFVALHLSGGTTEVLHVEPECCQCLGGTGDISAGQLIDRVGVRLGLPFPAGPHLEALAARGSAAARVAATTNGLTCHFSGAEAQAMRMIDAGAVPAEDIAAEVFSCVARAVSRLILAACEQTGRRDVLLGGGVASSPLLKTLLAERVPKRSRAIRLHFASPELSGDNAVGVALIGAERWSADCKRYNLHERLLTKEDVVWRRQSLMENESRWRFARSLRHGARR